MGFGSWLKGLGKKIWGGVKTVWNGAKRGVKWLTESPIGKALTRAGTTALSAVNPVAGQVLQKGIDILGGALKANDDPAAGLKQIGKDVWKEAAPAISKRFGMLPYGGVNIAKATN